MMTKNNYLTNGDIYKVARRKMIAEQIIPAKVKNNFVLDAMMKVPRHEFVSPGMENQAYEDRPLPIGLGQTISQPAMVAIMTEALTLNGTEKVLEIGTGSGYQAAILALLCKEVFTIERHSDLSIRARKVLFRMRLSNIKYRIGDGTLGWPEQAPFDRIVVTAGAPVVPEMLINQLADGGMLLIPVGNEDMQYLERVIKQDGRLKRETMTACRFVKLVGENGWRGCDAG